MASKDTNINTELDKAGTELQEIEEIVDLNLSFGIPVHVTLSNMGRMDLYQGFYDWLTSDPLIQEYIIGCTESPMVPP